ncbi:hypothetical protein [Cupriavidus oxalaticus]|uniref:hypothetical protein n=1 Tax=Cupriavidus oxalaticus TaxID=96344 RepID=UPI004034130D
MRYVVGYKHSVHVKKFLLMFLGLTMLRVQIELLPNGDETASRILGEVTIANDGSGSIHTGNYLVVMNEYDERTPGRKTAYRTTAVIEDMERDIMRPMQIVGVALGLLAPAKRSISNTMVPVGRVLSQGEVDPEV